MAQTVRKPEKRVTWTTIRGKRIPISMEKKQRDNRLLIGGGIIGLGALGVLGAILGRKYGGRVPTQTIKTAPSTEIVKTARQVLQEKKFALKSERNALVRAIQKRRKAGNLPFEATPKLRKKQYSILQQADTQVRSAEKQLAAQKEQLRRVQKKLNTKSKQKTISPKVSLPTGEGKGLYKRIRRRKLVDIQDLRLLRRKIKRLSPEQRAEKRELVAQISKKQEALKHQKAIEQERVEQSKIAIKNKLIKEQEKDAYTQLVKAGMPKQRALLVASQGSDEVSKQLDLLTRYPGGKLPKGWEPKHTTTIDTTKEHIPAERAWWKPVITKKEIEISQKLRENLTTQVANYKKQLKGRLSKINRALVEKQLVIAQRKLDATTPPKPTEWIVKKPAVIKLPKAVRAQNIKEMSKHEQTLYNKNIKLLKSAGINTHDERIQEYALAAKIDDVRDYAISRMRQQGKSEKQISKIIQTVMPKKVLSPETLKKIGVAKESAKQKKIQDIQDKIRSLGKKRTKEVNTERKNLQIKLKGLTSSKEKKLSEILSRGVLKFGSVATQDDYIQGKRVIWVTKQGHRIPITVSKRGRVNVMEQVPRRKTQKEKLLKVSFDILRNAAVIAGLFAAVKALKGRTGTVGGLPQGVSPFKKYAAQAITAPQRIKAFVKNLGQRIKVSGGVIKHIKGKWADFMTPNERGVRGLWKVFRPTVKETTEKATRVSRSPRTAQYVKDGTEETVKATKAVRKAYDADDLGRFKAFGREAYKNPENSNIINQFENAQRRAYYTDLNKANLWGKSISKLSPEQVQLRNRIYNKHFGTKKSLQDIFADKYVVWQRIKNKDVSKEVLSPDELSIFKHMEGSLKRFPTVSPTAGLPKTIWKSVEPKKVEVTQREVVPVKTEKPPAQVKKEKETLKKVLPKKITQAAKKKSTAANVNTVIERGRAAGLSEHQLKRKEVQELIKDMSDKDLKIYVKATKSRKASIIEDSIKLAERIIRFQSYYGQGDSAEKNARDYAIGAGGAAGLYGGHKFLKWRAARVKSNMPKISKIKTGIIKGAARAVKRKELWQGIKRVLGKKLFSEGLTFSSDRKKYSMLGNPKKLIRTKKKDSYMYSLLSPLNKKKKHIKREIKENQALLLNAIRHLRKNRKLKYGKQTPVGHVLQNIVSDVYDVVTPFGIDKIPKYFVSKRQRQGLLKKYNRLYKFSFEPSVDEVHIPGSLRNMSIRYSQTLKNRRKVHVK